jgi:hypothetical protein
MDGGITRRGALGAFGMLASGRALAQGAPPLEPNVPLVLPRGDFVWEAVVELAPTVAMGEGPLGERRLVPITGGVFAGPRIRGRVLPGGADR